MWLAVITLFPDMFKAISDFGVTGRAIGRQVELSFWNPRDFTQDSYQSVDDRPFGGGPGMVMQVDPLVDALDAAKKAAFELGLNPKVIYMSPQGKVLNQATVNNTLNQQAFILIAGRYEGIDERFIEAFVDEEWSIGDYVLSGGELACMVVIDSMVRQLPEVLGHEASAKMDSFAEGNEGLLDHPHYTRPERILGKSVPEVLLSGHHEKIKSWRLEQSLRRTRTRRPDILKRLIQQDALSGEAKKILASIEKEESGQN